MKVLFPELSLHILHKFSNRLKKHDHSLEKYHTSVPPVSHRGSSPPPASSCQPILTNHRRSTATIQVTPTDGNSLHLYQLSWWSSCDTEDGELPTVTLRPRHLHFRVCLIRKTTSSQTLSRNCKVKKKKKKILTKLNRTPGLWVLQQVAPDQKLSSSS